MEEQDKISNGHFSIPIFWLAYANTHGICIPTVFEFKSQHGVKLDLYRPQACLLLRRKEMN